MITDLGNRVGRTLILLLGWLPVSVTAQVLEPPREVAVTPVLRIGGSDWEGENAFVGTVTDAGLLSTGAVAYFDGQLHILRLTDSEGALRHEVGREGRGPEEWSDRVSGLVVLDGDTVVVVDPGNRKLGFVTPDGAYGRSAALSGGAGAQWRVVGDSILVHDSYLPPATLTKISLTTARAELFYRFDYEAAPIRRGNVPLAPILAPAARWAVVDQHLVTAVSSEPMLEVLDWDGTVAEVIRIDRAPRPVSRQDRQRLRELWEQRLALGDIPQSMWSRIEVTYPESLPVIGHVSPGPEQTVWVQRPPDVQSMRPSELAGGPLHGLGEKRWDVFSLVGEQLGSVEFPYRLRIMDVGDDSLLTLRQDDLGRHVLETWLVSSHE